VPFFCCFAAKKKKKKKEKMPLDTTDTYFSGSSAHLFEPRRLNIRTQFFFNNL
jgi:hypothetical protein